MPQIKPELIMSLDLGGRWIGVAIGWAIDNIFPLAQFEITEYFSAREKLRDLISAHQPQKIIVGDMGQKELPDLFIRLQVDLQTETTKWIKVSEYLTTFQSEQNKGDHAQAAVEILREYFSQRKSN